MNTNTACIQEHFQYKKGNVEEFSFRQEEVCCFGENVFTDPTDIVELIWARLKVLHNVATSETSVSLFLIKSKISLTTRTLEMAIEKLLLSPSLLAYGFSIELELQVMWQPFVIILKNSSCELILSVNLEMSRYVSP